MIETWRQCYTGAHVTKAEVANSYFVLGPLRGEGYIKEVRIVLGSERTMVVFVAAVICGTGQGTAEELETGNRIIERSITEFVGLGPYWHAPVGFVVGAQVVIPLWRKVDSGSRYVIFGIRPTQDFVASLLATVTVVGMARTGANGLGVEDGLGR